MMMTDALTRTQRDRVVTHSFERVQTEHDLRELVYTVRDILISIPGHHDCRAISTGICLALNLQNINTIVVDGVYEHGNDRVPHTWVEIPNQELVFTDTNTGYYRVDATINQFTIDHEHDDNIFTTQLSNTAHDSKYCAQSRHDCTTDTTLRETYS